MKLSTIFVYWFSPGDVLLKNLSTTSSDNTPRKKKLSYHAQRAWLWVHSTGLSILSKELHWSSKGTWGGKVTPSKANSSAGGLSAMLLPYCLMVLLFSAHPIATKESQNHRAGRDHRGHRVQSPAMQELHQSTPDRWPSNLCLKTSKEGDSTRLWGSIFHCRAALTVRMFFLRFRWNLFPVVWNHCSLS